MPSKVKCSYCNKPFYPERLKVRTWGVSKGNTALASLLWQRLACAVTLKVFLCRQPDL